MLAALSPSARRQASPARGAARIYRVMAKWHLLSKRWPELSGRNSKAAFPFGA